MKDIIINQPELQSFRQKCASHFLTVLSWCLWLYFLLPLFTLGGWLLGVKSLSDEIRWFGGYKTLLQLLQMYGEIIVLIALAWLVWTLLISWFDGSVLPKRQSPVSEAELSESYKVDAKQLTQAKQQQVVTVHFDSHANIVDMRWLDGANNRSKEKSS